MSNDADETWNTGGGWPFKAAVMAKRSPGGFDRGWQEALESKGLKVNADKTETMVSARTEETLQIKDKTGKALKQVENFRYLGSVIHAQGGSEEDIKARIAAAWKKWKELSAVLCDRRMPIGVKEKYTEQW